MWGTCGGPAVFGLWLQIPSVKLRAEAETELAADRHRRAEKAHGAGCRCKSSWPQLHAGLTAKQMWQRPVISPLKEAVTQVATQLFLATQGGGARAVRTESCRPPSALGPECLAAAFPPPPRTCQSTSAAE